MIKNKIIYTLLIVFFSGITYSQSPNSSINIGDVFSLSEVSNNNYKHINFPRPNFIIKKGGIANYNNIKGKRVEIKSINKKKDGSLIATIQLTSKKLFFNSHKYVTVDIKEAIIKKELIKI